MAAAFVLPRRGLPVGTAPHGPGCVSLVTDTHTEPRSCCCGGARVPQAGFLRAPRAQAVIRERRGPDGLSPRPRGLAGTQPHCVAFPPSALRTHPSASISPLDPSRDPSFLPAPPALARPRRPSRPQPLHPGWPLASPGFRKGGAQTLQGRWGRPRTARLGSALARQPRLPAEP